MWVYVLLLALWATPALADVPDVVLASVVGKGVVLELSDGSTVAGQVSAYDAEWIAILGPDGAVAPVARAQVTAVRVDAASPSPSEPAAIAAARPAEPVDEPETRSTLLDRQRRYRRLTSLAAGPAGVAIGFGTGILGGTADNAALRYFGPAFGGFLVGVGSSAPGMHRLRDPEASPAEIAAGFRASAIRNFAIGVPVTFAAGLTADLLARANGGSDIEGLYLGEVVAGFLYGMSAGYLHSGLRNQRVARDAGALGVDTVGVRVDRLWLGPDAARGAVVALDLGW